MITTAPASVPYRLKPSRYSSHSLLLEAIPQEGRGRKMLDVGCSEGYLATLLADRGYSVTGVEAPGSHGSDFPSNVNLIEWDLERGLPRLSGSFDYIICGDLLEHLRDPLSLLSQLRPLLAPGGRLLASLPNSGNIYFRANVMVGRFPRHDRGLFDRTHLQFFMWRGWLELFAAAGYQVRPLGSTAVPFSLLRPGLATATAEWVWFQMARAWKRMFAYQFVVEAMPSVNP